MHKELIFGGAVMILEMRVVIERRSIELVPRPAGRKSKIKRKKERKEGSYKTKLQMQLRRTCSYLALGPNEGIDITIILHCPISNR